MGRSQREKGARGERELAKILGGRRTGQAQSQHAAPDADISDCLPGYFIECKRQERVQIEAWCKKAEDEAGELVPVVIWRRNNQPWRVTMLLDDFLSNRGAA